MRESPHFWAATAGRPYVLAAALAVIFMAAIEGTIVATAMPTMVGQLGGFELYSWVFTTYLLTQAVTTPIYGRLADLYGRKRVLLAGIALFLIGSLLCGLAGSMTVLVACRALQGIGSGALVPVALTIIGDLYPPAERARMQGILSSVWAVAAILGPVVGAYLVEELGWPMVFWVNLPIGVLAAAMLGGTLREAPVARQHRIDAPGALLMTLAVTLLMVALVEASALSRAGLGALLAAAALAFLLLIRHERRAPEPMLPLTLWRSRIIAGGNLASLGIGAVMMGTTAFLPTYVQGVMGETPLVAGAVLTAMSISWSAGATLAGRLMLRTSYRTCSTLGGAALVAGSLVMVLLDPARGIAWATAGALLTGLGMGLVNNSFTVAIQSSVGWGERGIATSSTVFMRMMGATIGTAVYGGILNAVLGGALAGGSALVDRLLDPALRHTVPAEAMAPLAQAIAEALHDIYLIDGLLAFLVLAAAATAMPRRLSPLRPAPP